MVPSPDSPPIRIVTSFTIECSPRKLSTAPYAQHAARPCYCGYFLLLNTSRNLSFGIATYQYRRFVSVPEYSHWQGLFLRKTGGTEHSYNIPNYITLQSGYNIRNYEFCRTRENPFCSGRNY